MSKLLRAISSLIILGYLNVASAATIVSGTDIFTYAGTGAIGTAITDVNNSIASIVNAAISSSGQLFTTSTGSTSNTTSTTSGTTLNSAPEQTVAKLQVLLSSPIYVNQPTTITVQAVDVNGRIVPTYQGSVLFTTDNGADTVPAAGSSYTFTRADGGQKTFVGGLVFRRTGLQKVYLTDLWNGLASQGIANVLSPTSTTGTTTTGGQTTGTSTNTQTTGGSTTTTQTNTYVGSPIIYNPAYPATPLGAYTDWEMVHRYPMLQGFYWTGATAYFITPKMFIGTPLTPILYQQNPSGTSTNTIASIADRNPLNYQECVEREFFLSFGRGQRIEKTDVAEMRAIAKHCAKTFYGKYFTGKSYTTREEFLMMMFTVFGENITLDGMFDEKTGTYTPMGNGTPSGFANVGQKAWYAPYLARAQKLHLLENTSTQWNIAQPVTDTDIVHIIGTYTAYRMNFTGDTLEQGTLSSSKMSFSIRFVDERTLTLQIR